MGKNAEIWIHYQPETNGNGLSNIVCEKDSCPIPNFNMGVLTAKIKGTVYSIGSSCVFSAIESGEIFLQINDDNLSTNAGVLAVVINVNQLDNIPRSSDACGTIFNK